MKVHEILRTLRRDRDLTQQNVAEGVEIDITTYNRYEKESGSRLIQLALLEKLAAFYEMTLTELLSYGEEPTVPLYEKKRTVTVSVELDGEKKTVDYWIDKLKKINTAIS